MGAKNHLNHIYYTGSLVAAGVAGLATGSLLVFGGVFFAAVAYNTMQGNIR